MTQQILNDLLAHLSFNGKRWTYTVASDFEKLYRFYCRHLNLEPLKLISTRKSLIRDAIEADFPELAYVRLKVKYGNKWCEANCLVHKAHAKMESDRMPFNGLLKQVAIDDGEITFVKENWLKTFYLKQADMLGMVASTPITQSDDDGEIQIVMDLEQIWDLQSVLDGWDGFGQWVRETYGDDSHEANAGFFDTLVKVRTGIDVRVRPKQRVWHHSGAPRPPVYVFTFQSEADRNAILLMM